MTSSFSPNPNFLLPENFILPDDPEEFRVKLRQHLNDIAIAVNNNVYGLFSSEETFTGKDFLPTFSTDRSQNATFRDVFRVVIDTGTLPNAGTSTTPHGITTTQNFSITTIYGGATDPGVSTITRGIPLPYINTTTPGDSVEVDIDATNIRITTTTGNYTSFTRSFIVIEYIKEV
jgi:hypothetical protein